MKRVKRFSILVVVALTVSYIMTSCAGFSSLSDEEAYNLGYGIGKTAGYYLNN